jgi:hypothetical protein
MHRGPNIARLERCHSQAPVRAPTLERLASATGHLLIIEFQKRIIGAYMPTTKIDTLVMLIADQNGGKSNQMRSIFEDFELHNFYGGCHHGMRRARVTEMSRTKSKTDIPT